MHPRSEQLKALLVPLFTAIRFLTLLPFSWRVGDDVKYFSASLYYFPAVGLLIGSFGYMLAKLLCVFFPIQIAAVAILFFLACISGCLHLDGAADSADGLLSSRPREQALEIMKDSRTGAMGVIALVFLLLGKYAALSSMNTEVFCLAVFFMPLAGRCAILFAMAIQKYARKEGGLGQLFYSEKIKKPAILALIFLLITLAVFAPEILLILPVALFFTVVLFARWCNAKLGGATGDTLGASCEIAELATSLVFASLL
jgi:adenosylcobinamide-GDP ribazoletransferase